MALKVLIAMLEEESFYFPKLQASMSCAEIKLPESKYKEVCDDLANAQKVVNFLDCLHITSDLELESLPSKDMAELNMLYGL